MGVLDKINIKPETQQLFLNYIDVQNGEVVFLQSGLAREKFPCSFEKISGFTHILPDTVFNIIDFNPDAPKTDLYIFSSHTTAIAFLQINTFICLDSTVFVVIANHYPKAYIDYIKSLYPFVKRICMVFPDNVYGLIDDIKTLLFWKNISHPRFYMENENLTISFNNLNFKLTPREFNLSSFKKVYRGRFFFHKAYKPSFVDYKYLLNIIDNNY
ncbi:MAG: hypothetical protein Q4G63_04320 [Bacteroidia bacterium]|nr:hypothetical protein [Bacteroidia bacterium]